MHQPFPFFLFASQASQPDATVLAAGLVAALLAVLLDLTCMNYCLNDLNRRATVSGGNRQMWALIIIVGGPLGQAAYWLYGRGPY